MMNIAVLIKQSTALDKYCKEQFYCFEKEMFMLSDRLV